MGVEWDSCPKANSLPLPPLDNQWAKSFYGWREGASYRDGSNSDSHLKIGHTVG